VGPTLVAMATKFGLDAEIQSPTGLSVCLLTSLIINNTGLTVDLHTSCSICSSAYLYKLSQSWMILESVEYIESELSVMSVTEKCVWFYCCSTACLCVSVVGENLTPAEGARVIDARGKLVMPGKLVCSS